MNPDAADRRQFALRLNVLEITVAQLGNHARELQLTGRDLHTFRDERAAKDTTGWFGRGYRVDS